MKKVLRVWQRDLFLACGMFVFTLISMFYAIKMPDKRMKFFLARADTYVILWTVVLMLLSILLLFRTILTRNTESMQKECSRIWTPMTVITAIVMLGYTFLLEILGFILDTAIMLMILFAVYSWKSEGRPSSGGVLFKQILTWGIATTVTIISVYFLFTKGLGVILPTFSLF